MQIISLRLPAHWASYLINGDHSGLSTKEKQEIDSFIGDYETMHNMTIACLECEESYFAHRNDANNIGGEVSEFLFQITSEY